MCGIAAGRSDLIEQDSSGSHDARRLHGSTCGIPAAARHQDAGGASRAPEPERVAHCRIFKPASEGDARALSMLPKHPDYAIAKKQMAGAGGVLSFEVDGNGADACRVAEALNLFTFAPSLGGVDSLVTIPG